MAGRGSQTFKKRQKEQQRKEKAEEKRVKRLQRKEEGPESQDDLILESNPNLEGIAEFLDNSEFGKLSDSPPKTSNADRE